MEGFTLINKNRDRIKIFKPFEDVSKPSPTIDAMEIQYACVYKRSSKPATPEFIEGATNTFALWWMSTYETIIKGGK